MTYNLDQNFGAAVVAAGLGGLQFAWDVQGNLYLSESLTPEQVAAIESTASSYKPQ